MGDRQDKDIGHTEMRCNRFMMMDAMEMDEKATLLGDHSFGYLDLRSHHSSLVMCDAHGRNFMNYLNLVCCLLFVLLNAKIWSLTFVMLSELSLLCMLCISRGHIAVDQPSGQKERRYLLVEMLRLHMSTVNTEKVYSGNAIFFFFNRPCCSPLDFPQTG